MNAMPSADMQAQGQGLYNSFPPAQASQIKAGGGGGLADILDSHEAQYGG